MLQIFVYPGQGPRTDQSAHPTNVLLGEPISCIGVLYGNMGEGLLTGAEMTQRQRHPRSPHSMGDSSESWAPGEHASLHMAQQAGESPFQGPQLV